MADAKFFPVKDVSKKKKENNHLDEHNMELMKKDQEFAHENYKEFNKKYKLPPSEVADPAAGEYARMKNTERQKKKKNSWSNSF